ncbi:MAG: hypothetical protein KDB21_12920, partial [Acidimicrobiales bacterium]|nr:hypothetical protein [Acidimicrobiales bacterium]
MAQAADPIPYDFAAGPSLPAAEHASLKERAQARVVDAANLMATVMRRPLSGELDELNLIEGRPVHGERLRIRVGSEELGELVIPASSMVGLADLVMGGVGWID